MSDHHLCSFFVVLERFVWFHHVFLPEKEVSHRNASFVSLSNCCTGLRKIKNPTGPSQQQQQDPAIHPPIVNENKENLLNPTNRQLSPYSRDNQSGGFEYSTSLVSPASLSKKVSSSARTSSPIKPDKNLSKLRASGDPTSKIHIDVSHNPSDKSLLVCDSSEASPRDYTDTGLSSLPPHKVRRNSLSLVRLTSLRD